MKNIILSFFVSILLFDVSNAATISLDWDPDNGSSHTQNQCTIGNNVVLPSQPSKPGYIFNGWALIPHQCSIAEVNPDTQATQDSDHIRWKALLYTQETSMEGVFGTENSSDLDPGEWEIVFDYGSVRGEALCSETAGTTPSSGEIGNPSQTSGSNLWCKPTSYTSSTNENCLTDTTNWIFFDNVDTPEDCQVYTVFCPYYLAMMPSWRVNAYGSTYYSNICTYSGVDVSTNGDSFGYINDSNSSSPATYNASTFGLTEDNTWGVSFDYGVVICKSLCSTTSGTVGNTGTPSTTAGQHCWLRPESFTPDGGQTCDTIYTLGNAYIYLGDMGGEDDCGVGCAVYSGVNIQNSNSFRQTAYMHP